MTSTCDIFNGNSQPRSTQTNFWAIHHKYILYSKMKDILLQKWKTFTYNILIIIICQHRLGILNYGSGMGVQWNLLLQNMNLLTCSIGFTNFLRRSVYPHSMRHLSFPGPHSSVKWNLTTWVIVVNRDLSCKNNATQQKLV